MGGGGVQMCFGVGEGGGGNSYLCSKFGSGFVLLLMNFTVLPKGAVFATCVSEFAKLSIIQKNDRYV